MLTLCSTGGHHAHGWDSVVIKCFCVDLLSTEPFSIGMQSYQASMAWCWKLRASTKGWTLMTTEQGAFINQMRATWEIYIYPMLHADSLFWLVNNREIWSRISRLTSSAWDIKTKERHWWRHNGDSDRRPISITATVRPSNTVFIRWFRPD